VIVLGVPKKKLRPIDIKRQQEAVQRIVKSTNKVHLTVDNTYERINYLLGSRSKAVAC
jgi:hypothetical protein